jgi:hypothetical protein
MADTGSLLAELDRLDPEQRSRLRLVRLDLGDEGFRPVTLDEELERDLGLRADDAVEEVVTESDEAEPR